MSTLLKLLADRQVWSVALKTALVLLVAPATMAAKQVLTKPEPARWTIPQADWSFRAASRAALTAHRGGGEEARRPARTRPVEERRRPNTLATVRGFPRRSAPERPVHRQTSEPPTATRRPPAAAVPRGPSSEQDDGEDRDDKKSGGRAGRGDDRPRGDGAAAPAPPEEPPAPEEPRAPDEPDDERDD